MSANKSGKKAQKSVINANNSKNITSTMSQLRRLQIQENLLIKCIKSGLSHDDLEDEQFINIVSCASTSKNIAKTQSAFVEIRNLFQEVAINSCAPNLDTKEIKKDIINLEMKIKMQKLSLNGELNALRKSENEISQELDENLICRNKEADKLKKKIQTFDDIVPSPVKNIINSPMKSCEIQEFQDFLSLHKRHGGWIEYHHNTFVRIWKKHLGKVQETENQELLFKTKQFQKFVKELLETIKDVTLDAILEHSQWFLTFLTLKNRQQQVLIEWKRKKNILKHTHYKPNDIPSAATKHSGNFKLKGSVQLNQTGSSLSTPYCQSPSCDSIMDTSSSSNTMSCNSSMISNERSSLYLRTTKQWTSKCLSYEEVDKWKKINNLNVLEKLRIPSWRKTLVE